MLPSIPFNTGDIPEGDIPEKDGPMTDRPSTVQNRRATRPAVAAA